MKSTLKSLNRVLICLYGIGFSVALISSMGCTEGTIGELIVGTPAARPETPIAPVSASSPSIKSSISALSSRTIAPGGEVGPVVFEIGHTDESIELGSLQIEAHSSNQGLIPDANVEIDASDLSRCSVRVRHVGETIGQSQISLVVRDENGITSKASFLVIVQDQSVK
jgi:hypothetical protein